MKLKLFFLVGILKFWNKFLINCRRMNELSLFNINIPLFREHFLVPFDIVQRFCSQNKSKFTL